MVPRGPQPRKKEKSRVTRAKDTRRYLEMLADQFPQNTQFKIICRKCPESCKLNKPVNEKLSAQEFLTAWAGHFEALDVRTATQQVRFMHWENAKLEQTAEDLRKRLQEEERDGVVRQQEANQMLETAKVMEQNSKQVISEQLAVNESLLHETARLKRELNEAVNMAEASAQCVICRDAKPSKAFVPCGHVCVCSSCWDEFTRSSGSKCPKCRREI